MLNFDLRLRPKP